MRKRVHILYSGRVQGVGFRFTAEAIARKLELSGWVKNLRDGRVEVLAEGEEPALKDFLSRLSNEMSPYIFDTEVSWEGPTGEFSGFGIAFDR